MALKESSFGTKDGEVPASVRRLRMLAWGVTILAGFLQAWAARFWISADGNNYLDVASAYLRGDWKNAVNAYWSPLFSWLLAACFGILRPHPYWESTLLHLLNFAGLLAALRAFEYFFRGFLRMQKQVAPAAEADDLAWWTLGYGLFLSTSLFVQSVIATTPDMWVAVFTYIVVGLILRIHTGGGSWSLFAVLGFTLGCAYLTKSFYFPMAFVFLPTAWLATENPRRTIRQALLVLVVFGFVAGPWIAALTHAKGRVTFGDVGKLNFAMMIDRIPQPFFWQGEDSTGTPKHPVRQLLSKPRLFEFATPVGGTYPPSYDLSYWMEGARFRFRGRGFLAVLRQSAGSYFQFLMSQIEYGVGLLLLLFLARGKPAWIFLLRNQSFLWLPPLIACASYALVLVEGRYVAPFLLILWIAAFSCFLGAASGLSGRVAMALVLAMVSVTGLRAAKVSSSDLFAILAPSENINWEVAEGLRNLGIRPGDKISGLSRVAEAHWARLAGVKIVSEIPLGDEDVFWSADPETKRKVFQLLAGTGATVVVTKDPPLTAASEGWIPLGTTGFYAYRLTPPAAR